MDIFSIIGPVMVGPSSSHTGLGGGRAEFAPGVAWQIHLQGGGLPGKAQKQQNKGLNYG